MADGLNAPFTGAGTLEVCRERVDEIVLVTEDEIEEGMRFSTRGRSSHVSPQAQPRSLRSGRKGRPRGRSDGRGRVRRQRGSESRGCYPGPPMKTDIHPEYVLAHVTCSCGNEFWTRSTKEELHVEICAECHPFYTGKQKLVDTGGRVERFQRRLEKAGSRSGDD